MKFIVLAALVACALAAPQLNVQPKKQGNPDEWGPYYQGDIKFKDGKDSKNGLLDEVYRWTDNTITYKWGIGFANGVGDKTNVLRAMDDYRNLTNGCVDFKEVTTATNYVTFTQVDNEGCFSFVGMIGGPQQLNYPQWCLDTYGSVQHEMYHAFGFFHEQSRTDRDEYVTIMYDNIQEGAENNFEKYDDSYITDFNETYDYLSVMHYGQYGFSINGDPTIVTKDPDYQDLIGQRDGLSDSDLAKLLKMYNCP